MHVVQQMLDAQMEIGHPGALEAVMPLLLWGTLGLVLCIEF